MGGVRRRDSTDLCWVHGGVDGEEEDEEEGRRQEKQGKTGEAVAVEKKEELIKNRRKQDLPCSSFWLTSGPTKFWK